jgi:hypothetical protein
LIEAIKQISGFFGLFCKFCGDRAGTSQTPALENRFKLLEQFCRINAPMLVHKLGYAWLKCGLSAQHGLCRTTPWKKPIPAEAVLVEGEASRRNIRRQSYGGQEPRGIFAEPSKAIRAKGGESVGERCRVYLAELEEKYLFVYGQYPGRQANAVYVLKNAS